MCLKSKKMSKRYIEFNSNWYHKFYDFTTVALRKIDNENRASKVLKCQMKRTLCVRKLKVNFLVPFICLEVKVQISNYNEEKIVI